MKASRAPILRSPRPAHAAVLFIICGLLSGCAVGPHYSRPTAPTAPAYNETPKNWKQAQPADQFAHGKWWEVYQDPALNGLEEKIEVSNQALKAAEAQFQQARAAVGYYRANYYPTVTGGVNASRNRLSKNRPIVGATTNYTDLALPIDVSYEPDVWGRVRRTMEAASANAQASAADLEYVRLSLHAELAIDYFEARALDSEIQFLNSTVEAYGKALQLTNNRYQGGIASQVDVAQAQTQLETTRAQAIDLTSQRAAYEHAMAVLIGEPPANYALPTTPLNTVPPVIPPGLPSDLLERRPDIAAAERRMVAANAQIGLARTAYFPTISLSASGGFEGNLDYQLAQRPQRIRRRRCERAGNHLRRWSAACDFSTGASRIRPVRSQLPAGRAHRIPGSGR